MVLEEGEIVLCTVIDIVGTVVHVKIENNGDGSIITSEIAPGRIRNLRDYVVPNKKIVCKVLRVSGDRVDLSLRRVTMKERKEVLEEHNKEQTAKNILRSILKDKAQEIIQQLESKNEKVQDFFIKIKDNPEQYKKIFSKEELERIIQIASKQKNKKISIKKEVEFSTDRPDGLLIIKKILENDKIEIKYLAAGKYSAKIESENLKESQHLMQQIMEEIEARAKQEKVQIEIKDRK